LEIGRATLDGWVMRVGEMLIPVTQAMRQDLLKASYLQADETTVPVQMHDGRGSNHEAYLWRYGKPGGETVFDFCLGRGREGPKKFLGNWEGILQTDGYQAYDGIGGPTLVHVGCWAHYLEAGVCRCGEGESARRRGSVDGDAHGRTVLGGPGCAQEGDERGGATGTSTRVIAGICGRDPGKLQVTAADGTPEKRVG
jgi:hypothetical protein